MVVSCQNSSYCVNPVVSCVHPVHPLLCLGSSGIETYTEYSKIITLTCNGMLVEVLLL